MPEQGLPGEEPRGAPDLPGEHGAGDRGGVKSAAGTEVGTAFIMSDLVDELQMYVAGGMTAYEAGAIGDRPHREALR
jgi:hypothetical protein